MADPVNMPHLDALLRARILAALCSPGILPPAADMYAHLTGLLQMHLGPDDLGRLEALAQSGSRRLVRFVDDAIAAFVGGYQRGYLDGCGHSSQRGCA